MMLRRPVGGKATAELVREAALCEAARAAVVLSCTEAWRAASARQGFSRALVRRVGLPQGSNEFIQGSGTPIAWRSWLHSGRGQVLVQSAAWRWACAVAEGRTTIVLENNGRATNAARAASGLLDGGSPAGHTGQIGAL